MRHSLIIRVLFLVLGTFSMVYAQNNNVTLIANVNDYPSVAYNDCWGYSAPDSREYAILGVRNGTSIIDVTDSGNIAEVAFIPGSACLWYDMKTYQNYLYVVNQCFGGMQIIDLSALPKSASLVATYTGFQASHNIYIDEVAGILYVEGNSSEPVRVLSLNDPINPVQIATLGIECHDVFAQNSLLYVAEGNQGSIGIYDVSVPTNPTFVTRVHIPSPGYVHNVWVTEDDRYMITTEETIGKTVKMWDIQDLDNITLVDEYLGENQFAHNAFIKGNFVYLSHYVSGLKILDIANPTIMVEIGNYDTAPGNNFGGGGAWGAYPFTQNGTIFISDFDTGLYVVEFNEAPVYRLFGNLKDADTGEPIPGGRIEVLETGAQLRSNANGVFQFGQADNGNFTFRAQAFAYESGEFGISAVVGNTDSIEINLQPTARSSIVGTVTDASNAPVENIVAHLLLNSTLLDQPVEFSTVTDAQGQFVFDDLPVSQGDAVSYDSLYLEPIFPFAPIFSGGLTVTQDNPTFVDFQMQPADVLIVNDDPNENYSEFYKNEVLALNTTYHEWITTKKGQEVPVPVNEIDQLNNDIIIWFTGDADFDVLTTVEQEDLTQFLEGGGKLFLTGQNIAESLNAQNSSFLTDHLQVAYGGNSDVFIMNAVAGNPITSGLGIISTLAGNGANNQTSRDILVPLQDGGAEPAFTYFQSSDAAGVTLESVDTGSKVVFFGFGFEGIGSSGQATSRSEVFEQILNWFDIAVSVENPGSNRIPRSFSLEQNYPNPFNPETIITYRLPRKSDVKLEIYNTIGQKVRTLVNSDQTSGSYQIVWNGRNDTGQQVPSGIYFYQIQTSDFSDIKRMVLLR